MKMTRRSALLALCALLLAVSGPSTIAQRRVDAETIGVPWGGEAGIERTTAEIMAEQAFAPERSAAEVNQTIRTPRPNAPQAVSTTFTGATFAETGAFPPDTMGAAGPTQFVVFLNGRLRTFNKTTGIADAVLNVDPDVFFNSVMTVPPGGGINFTIYPQVRYDRLTGRWILTIVDVPSSTPFSIGDIPNRVLIAVSDAASAGVITGAPSGPSISCSRTPSAAARRPASSSTTRRSASMPMRSTSAATCSARQHFCSSRRRVSWSGRARS